MGLQSLVSAGLEAFTDMSGSDSKRRDVYMELVSSILAFVLAIAIVSLVGKWLWNNVVIELFSVAKPAKSIWQILGLMIFLSLIR
jgi:hypothetical protein